MRIESRKKGFSLLEMTIVLSLVVAILLVGSSFKINNKRHQLDQAVDKVYSNLSLARFRSIYRQVPIRVSFDHDFCELAEYDSQNNSWITKSRQLLEGVEVTANNSPVFYPQGTVSNLATIKIKNERGSYQMSIAISGRIKVTRID